MSPEDFNKICQEFDKSPESHSWGPGHPIFQLAAENDKLRSLLKRTLELKAPEIAIDRCKLTSNKESMEAILRFIDDNCEIEYREERTINLGQKSYIVSETPMEEFENKTHARFKVTRQPVPDFWEKD